MTQQALKVTASTVTKLYIEGAERLDPISVYLEDLAPKKGKITVSHNGYSWTAFWPGMWEGRKIADWFAELNVQYVIGYFAPQMQPSQFSSEKVAATVKREILKMRRAKDLDWHRAREVFEECEGMELCESEEHLVGQYGDLLNEIVGDDWWDELQEAKEPNPYYTQLTRIILAVQQALKQSDTDICWSCSSPMPAGFALIKLDSRTGKPLVTSEMKVKHIGEYWWDEEAPYYDEHGDLHDYVARHAVPWSLCKEIYKSMASTAMLSAQPAEHKPSADDSLTPVPDELFAAEFAAWWDEHGQFCRAGGGAYERSFAFEAWRYLYPQLMNLQMAAAEHQPAQDVAALVEALRMLAAAGSRLNDEAEECMSEDGMAEVASSDYWGDFREALEAADAALAAYRKGGEA